MGGLDSSPGASGCPDLSSGVVFGGVPYSLTHFPETSSIIFRLGLS